MRAPKLVQHMTANAGEMSRELLQRIRSSQQCSQLAAKVPDSEQREYALQIYRDLTDWLAARPDPGLEGRYINLGVRRASQGVPVSSIFWGVCIARDYLWEYIQRECLVEDPVEFWGGALLLYSQNQFFDRILYSALLGYEEAADHEFATDGRGRRRSA